MAAPPVSGLVISSTPGSAAVVSAPPPGLTWAERLAIFKRVEAGQPITLEELRRLQEPIADLQAGTLAEDENWLSQLLESEGYLASVRDSREATNLRGALLAALKAINYWRSKP